VLDFNLFESSASRQQAREKLANHLATQLAEVAAHLRSESVRIRHEVRWDSPRSDAILRKIAEAKPDIVLKQGMEHSYLLGLTTNTDWDLARKSPAHLWLINDNVDDIDCIVAAVGNRAGDSDDITTAADYDLLRTAGFLADTFKAEIYPVNAYQVPPADGIVMGSEGMAIPVPPVAKQQEQQEEVVKQHKSALMALAQYFGIPESNVCTQEGQPNDVITGVAKKVDADLVVMGANSISRLERLVRPVTVEPVIAETNCDILVIRELDRSSVPDAKRKSFDGVPKFDLESAITNPEDTFESPQAVARVPELSIALRERILQAWEYDLRAEMAEENEGGPVGDIDVNALDDIVSAKQLLRKKSVQSSDDAAMLGSGPAL
jgi:universal stress protein E